MLKARPETPWDFHRRGVNEGWRVLGRSIRGVGGMHMATARLGNDISVVVQGPVLGAPSDPPEKRWTKRALESVRQVFPGAQLILSTWEGSDTAGLDADVILLNRDPGAESLGRVLNNVNRQIASTRAGLRAAERPFALKMRSESVLLNDGFRRYFGRYRRPSPAQVVKERVVALTVPSPTPSPRHRTCYCPSDWFHFGRREDVLDIWDIPLAPEPDTSRWFETRPFPPDVGSSGVILRYAAEQYIWATFLRKHHDVDFDSLWDVRPQTVGASEASLAANLVLVSPRQAGLDSLKYPDAFQLGVLGHIRRRYYSHAHWRLLYRRHCAGFRSPAVYPFVFHGVHAAARAYRSVKAAVGAA